MWGNEDPYVLVDELRDAADGGGQQRSAHPGRLDQRVGRPLVVGQEHRGVAATPEPPHVFDRAKEADLPVQPRTLGFGLDVGLKWAVASEIDAPPRGGIERGERGEESPVAFSAASAPRSRDPPRRGGVMADCRSGRSRWRSPALFPAGCRGALSR